MQFMRARATSSTEQGNSQLPYNKATPDDIVRIALIEDFSPGWSEYTPGDGWELIVECYDERNHRIFTETHSQASKFINELCQFAAELVRNG